MKKIFIVDAYPSSPAKMNTLCDCIRVLKKTDYAIMVVSHCPVSEEVQYLADYVVYDKNNLMLPSNLTPFHVSQTDFFYAYIFHSGHSLAITRNMKNALSLTISEGYDFFFFVEFDCIFSDGDLLKLLQLQQQAEKGDKKMIFFKPEGFREQGSYVYETLLFGGDPTFFINRVSLPRTVEEWMQESISTTLELEFYKKLNYREFDYLIIPDHSHNYFSESVINKYRFGAMTVEFLENKDEPNTVMLFMSNANYVKSAKKVRVYHNGDMVDEKEIVPTGWAFRTYDLGDTTMIVRVEVLDVDTDIIEEEREFFINKNAYEQIRQRGYFKYK
jgi:hypothetical protein